MSPSSKNSKIFDSHKLGFFIRFKICTRTFNKVHQELIRYFELQKSRGCHVGAILQTRTHHRHLHAPALPRVRREARRDLARGPELRLPDQQRFRGDRACDPAGSSLHRTTRHPVAEELLPRWYRSRQCHHRHGFLQVSHSSSTGTHSRETFFLLQRDQD